MTALPRPAGAALLVALLLTTTAATAPPGEGSEPRLEPGVEGVALIALHSNRIQEVPLTFLGTFESFGGPGFDLHLVELGGEVGEVGVANG